MMFDGGLDTCASIHLLVEGTPWSVLFSIFFSNCPRRYNELHGAESQSCLSVQEITRILLLLLLRIFNCSWVDTRWQ
jgi:hypothetical protein